MKQKFHNGDLVQIAKDLGSAMEHFEADCRAIVIGSYRDQYGGLNTKDYTVFIEGRGKTSWYLEEQLTLIEKARHDLLDTWEEHAEARHRDYRDLNWIREHWEEVRKAPSATSILALFAADGYKSGFLRNGEYFTLFSEWESFAPIVDFIYSMKTIEELRAARKPTADQDIIERSENLWRKLHGHKDIKP